MNAIVRCLMKLYLCIHIFPRGYQNADCGRILRIEKHSLAKYSYTVEKERNLMVVLPFRDQLRCDSATISAENKKDLISNLGTPTVSLTYDETLTNQLFTVIGLHPYTSKFSFLRFLCN